MTVKAESGKGSARAWGDEEAAQPMGSRKAAACAVSRDRGTGERRAEDPHGSARRSPACARNVRKTLHDKEDDADPVRRRPAARPPSGECCKSDDTQPSVPPRFSDGDDVAHSRLSDVPGEGAAGLPLCSWAGGQKSSYNARHAGVAQLVERRLPKPEVASSRLVARSTFLHRWQHRVGGHGVLAHGQHPQGPQPSTSRSVPGRGSQRISAPGAHLISPCFSGNVRMKRGTTCRRRRVRAISVVFLGPATPAGSASLRKPVRHPNLLQSPGRPMKACPAHVLPENERSRRCPHYRAAPGPGAVTVSRAAPAGHAGWRHLPSARTTLR